MPGKTDDQRLKDIKSHLRRTRKGHTLLLKEAAAIWGVTKPRFVNKSAEMNWPDPIGKDGNADVYDKRQALTAMKVFLETNEKVGVKKAQRVASLTGAPDHMASEITGDLSMADLSRANQLRMQLQTERVEQGDLTDAKEVSSLLGWLFSEISEFFAELSNSIDPHGRLPGWARKHIDEGAEKLLLKLYAKIRKRLEANVDAAANRKPNTGSGSRKAPRKRK